MPLIDTTMLPTVMCSLFSTTWVPFDTNSRTMAEPTVSKISPTGIHFVLCSAKPTGPGPNVTLICSPFLAAANACTLSTFFVQLLLPPPPSSSPPPPPPPLFEETTGSTCTCSLLIERERGCCSISLPERLPDRSNLQVFHPGTSAVILLIIFIRSS